MPRPTPSRARRRPRADARRTNRIRGSASVVTVMVLALVASLETTGVARAERAAPGFVSVMFGRMQWTTVDETCTPLPNTVDLRRVHGALGARGIPATGIVITSWTRRGAFRCVGAAKVPGWNRIARWHSHGWSFVSGGTHADMTALTYNEQRRESCGSLRVFARRGIDASGMFAYGNNRYTAQMQANPVSRCFEFGRRYSGSLNRRGTAGPPWFAHVHSVNGGRCNDPALPCSTRRYHSPHRYWSPRAMARRVRAERDTWYALQFYRFVRGSHSGPRFAWNCSSPDWRKHFTSHSEMYCFRDFRHVMNALERAQKRGVVATDPETVAKAWGRSTARGA